MSGGPDFDGEHSVDYESLILAFTSIIYEAMPFIVLGVIIAGLLEEFVPQQAISKIMPSNRLLAICLGAVLGLVFPMCECGIIVVMKRLLRKGLPLGVCISYMLAGPIINAVVMTSTYVAFDPPDRSMALFGGPANVVLIRVGLGFVIAVITGLVVELQFRKYGFELLHPSVRKGLNETGADPDAGPRTWLTRLDNITRTALSDFIDIMAFLVLGAMLAAGGKALVQKLELETLIQSQPYVAILIMMGIAVLFCLCSEADAFVAANFPMLWPPAAKMAFMVLGPMLDLKLYIMYTRVFRPRLIGVIIAMVVSQVFIYCMVLDSLQKAGVLP